MYKEDCDDSNLGGGEEWTRLDFNMKAGRWTDRQIKIDRYAERYKKRERREAGKE